MTSYAPPKCLNCQYFKSNPKYIGDSASCLKYAKIHKKIFFQSGDCMHYKKIEKEKGAYDFK